MAFAVLIDASLVRMILVPSVMTLLGKNAWYLPGWLERFVPHMQLEGGEAGESALSTAAVGAGPATPAGPAGEAVKPAAGRPAGSRGAASGPKPPSRQDDDLGRGESRGQDDHGTGGHRA
jgi:putative drug exporter of the RND superfamily